MFVFLQFNLIWIYAKQDFATIIDKIFLDDSGTSGEISISAITIEKNPYICSSKSKDKKDKISNKHFGDSRYSVFDWDFKAYSKVELLEELEEETIVLLRISALGSNLSLENYERTYLYNRFKKFKIDDPNPIVHSAAGILKRILSVNGTHLKLNLEPKHANDKNIAAVLLVDGKIVAIGLKDKGDSHLQMMKGESIKIHQVFQKPTLQKQTPRMDGKIGHYKQI